MQGLVIVEGISTERLLLRPFRDDDADAVLAYACDDRWARYISREVAPENYTAEEARRFVLANMPKPDRPPTDFAIQLKHIVIGSVHLGVEPVRNIGELACLLAREHWARGYAREVGRAMVNYAFKELGLAKVWARADARNERSIRAMEAIGLRREGLLLSHRVDRHGVRCDEVIYGILQDGWQRQGSGAA